MTLQIKKTGIAFALFDRQSDNPKKIFVSVRVVRG
jgi:hypothetical protein